MAVKTDSEILRKERQDALKDLLRVSSQMSHFCFTLDRAGTAVNELWKEYDEARKRLKTASEKL